MDTFNFPNHLWQTENPDSAFRMQLGKGYSFAAAPDAPDRRLFHLTFAGMKYYVTGGGSIDTTTSPTINAAVLEAFYVAHKTYITFIYPHPVYGNVNVKFNKPLIMGKGVPDGGGLIEGFDIELIEDP